jgi:hypothetical protein
MGFTLATPLNGEEKPEMSATKKVAANDYNAPKFRPRADKPGTGYWYVWHDGKQQQLTKLGAPQVFFKPKSAEYAAQVVPAYLAWIAQQDAKAAQDAMQALAEAKRGPVSIGQVCVAYLKSLDVSLASVSYKAEAKRYLDDLCLGKDGQKGLGDLPAVQFTTSAFQGWLADHPSWKITKPAITPVVAAFNMAVGNRLIDALPFGKVKPVMGQARTDCFTAEELPKFRAACSKSYLAFFNACVATGCRPGELAKVTRKHVAADCSCIVLAARDDEGRAGWKNGTKGRENKTRTIYLSPAMQAEVKTRLAGLGTDDAPLYPTRVGTAWTKKTWGQAFRAALTASKINPKLDPYATRHYYITSAIKAGMTYAQVAELCGTSEEEIRKHYNHVGDDRKYMLDLAAKMAV